MAIELYFSNQLEQLADKFLDIVSEEIRNKVDIFEAPVVIVPNANLAKWLKLTIVEKNSIFMNMDLQYLESGLWTMLASLDPGETIPQRLDDDQLKIILLYALQNLENDDPDFFPITQYLMGEDGKKSPGYAARLWQLSEKLAYLFREYEFHRIEMIQKWLAGSVPSFSVESTEDITDMERCQQQLYLRLNKLKEEYSQRTGIRLLSMMEYAENVFSGLPSDADITTDKKCIHFFGLSQISAFHLKLIGMLKAHYNIFIYALNPSREFWEDIKTPREKKWIQRKNKKKLSIYPEERDQGELFLQEDNALLAAWGKPGRESIRLLCELTEYEFNACFTSVQTSTGILKRIQNDILTLSSLPHEITAHKQDRSLQIAACPSIYREVETIYNSIIFNLEQNDHLQLTDIAVLVPDISTYKPVFDSVFNRKPRCLAYNLVDAHAEIESIYGQAVLAILRLATGRFSRKEVFDLILNPCFMSHWKIDPEEVQTWAHWTETLNIFHSFDQRAKSARGYPESDAYTWKQGLQRIRLSRILTAPDREGIESFKHYMGLVPFSDMETGDLDLVEKFCMVIETLGHAVNRLKMKQVTGAQWKQVFFDVCDRLIEIPKDLKGEAIVLHTLIQAFDNLKLYDRLQDDQPSSPMDIELIREFVSANLGSISGGQGDYLTEGITISSLQPMRPIPFNIVYIMGMEEGNFPGRADTSSLDLRLLKRRIGDISLPERNCYLFLEMLLSTREKLYISFISRDLQKDRTLQSCSLVNQLRRYVEQEILPEGQRFFTSEIPLKGSSIRYLDPGAVDEWSDVMVNYSLADRIEYYRTNRLWKQFNQKASIEDLKRLKGLNPDLEFNVPTSENKDLPVEKITLKQLKKFLEDPVKQQIQRHLGLYDEKETIEDLILREDEPFFSEFPTDYNLKIDPIRQWLDTLFSPADASIGKPIPEDIYNLVYESYHRKGQTPDGAFAELDKNELRDYVSQITETLMPIIAQMKSAQKIYRAAFIGEHADEYIPTYNRLAVKRFESPSLTIQTRNLASETVTCKAELHGQLPWAWKDHNNRLHALILTGSGKSSQDPDKYVFEPLMFYMLCLIGEESAEWIGTSDVIFHVIYNQKAIELTYNLSEEISGTYIVNLVSDYLNQETPVWLPFKAAANLSIKPHKMPDHKIDDIVREHFAIELENAYSEAEDYLTRITKPKIPAEAFEMARGRFKIFFDHQKT